MQGKLFLKKFFSSNGPLTHGLWSRPSLSNWRQLIQYQVLWKMKTKSRLRPDWDHKSSNLNLHLVGFIRTSHQRLGCFLEEGITSCVTLCMQKEKQHKHYFFKLWETIFSLANAQETNPSVNANKSKTCQYRKHQTQFQDLEEFL